ncbi:hypothetical protein LT336_00538 [Spiroplasma sp. JKS002671]|uniref:hypothetical protein n=1 Tax=Spiroplasma attinicola TaxID=2904537 RepID=UPI002022A011|nr:hypothetical protein [Spiroplasma sp. JKS002671]MCL8210794.1 hypothetical protein [Spiroplasma sp. JKS002671]
MSIEKDKYQENFNLIKEKNSLIKNLNNRPILLFNSLDNEIPIIDISSMIFYFKDKNWEDLLKYSYFGNLAGSFTNYNEKSDFYYFMLVTIFETKDYIWKKEFLFFEKWISEISVLLEGLDNIDMLNFNNMKIYKYEAPDFLIELDNKEILAIEVTHSEVESSQWLLKNAFLIEKERREKGLKKYLEDLEITGYKSISEQNIVNIEKHFNKKSKYKKNVQKLYPNQSIKILYFVTLGGGSRFVQAEVENLKKIESLAIKYDISCENIFLQIGHKSSLVKFITLSEILADLK